MLSVVLTDAPGWMGPALAGALRRHAAVGRVLDGERALAVGEPDVDVLVHAVSSDGDTGGEAASLSRLRRALRAASGSGVSAVVLVSHATADLIVDHLPADARLVEPGTHELRDLDRPETVYLLTADPGAPVESADAVASPIASRRPR